MLIVIATILRKVELAFRSLECRSRLVASRHDSLMALQ